MPLLSVDWAAVAAALVEHDRPVWGPSIGAMRRLYVAAVLRRFNEAMALDHVIPFRVLGHSDLPP